MRTKLSTDTSARKHLDGAAPHGVTLTDWLWCGAGNAMMHICPLKKYHCLPCPECASEYTYETGTLLTCPMCAHEWSPAEEAEAQARAEEDSLTRDAFGNVLSDGDTVTLVQTVKVAGGGGTLKIGTKVRGIRLTEDIGDGHDIDARLPEVGRLRLKSSIVKKA